MDLLQPLLLPTWHWVCWSDSKLGPRAPLGCTKKELSQAPLQSRNWIPNGCFYSTGRPPLPLPPPPSHRASEFLCIREVLLTRSRIPNSNFQVWSIQHLQRKACFERSEGGRLIKSEGRANSIKFQKRIFSGERGVHASKRGTPYMSTRTAMGRTRCVGRCNGSQHYLPNTLTVQAAMASPRLSSSGNASHSRASAERRLPGS